MHRLPNNPRLLIVDDDAVVRALAAEALKAAGFDISEASDGPSGLALIEKSRPDLVLLDVVMPVMDGYEVCRVLRGRPELARMPVIMLTGLDDAASVEHGYEVGATDFITKPINATLLAYRVRYVLRASQMLEEIDRHRASLANAQRIARLGSWVWKPLSASFECSAQYPQVIGEHELKPNYQWRDILLRVHPDDTARVTQATEAAISAGEAYSIVYRILRRDGTECSVFEQTEVFRDAAGRVCRIEGMTQDITERVVAEAHIRKLADYDSLTGLANRRLFSEVMQLGLNRCEREQTIAAVLDINIDRFKRINETFGYAAGDRILQQVGRRIMESIRASDMAGTIHSEQKTDTFARMSGDGFAVFLSDLGCAEDAAQIARRVSAAIARPMKHAGLDLTLTASIGIAVYPENGNQVSTLLKNAESAVHSAKTSGAGTVSFFNPSTTTSALAKLDMENDLRAAIERDELLLFYQARVDAPTGRLVGAEGLVRWQHPRRGLVPPGEFIPIAEESGLIVPMTKWVLRAACHQLQQWQRAGLPVVPVSINFSARSFREDGLGELIATSLRESGISPSLLEGEITESMLMQDVKGAITRLNELRAIGIELAMDDFGTGYSSLAYLKHFPLNVLKIDRAFVKDVLSDAHDAAIASTIINMGKALGLAVVAEGMERVEQANFLLARGCRLMQGYLFARPVPAEAFAATLRDGLAMPAGLCTDLTEPSNAAQAQRLAHAHGH